MEEGGNKAAFREAVQMSSQAATSGVSKVVTSSFSTDGAAHTHTHTLIALRLRKVWADACQGLSGILSRCRGSRAADQI